MTATDTFLELVKNRRSFYDLGKESTIPDSRIEEIVNHAVTWAPSSFNVQSARAIILFDTEHDRFWDIAKKHMEQAPMAEKQKEYILGRVNAFRNAYGSVLWFEDQEALTALGEKNPTIQPLIPEWSDHSNGMYQYIVWTALEAEGLGCHLQHYNFHPGIVGEAAGAFGIPDSWKLKSQLVFGKINSPAKDKSFEPIGKRVLIKRGGGGDERKANTAPGLISAEPGQS